jgi:polynucleotide 5'-hydroxyl-kinase GRC3/NOL9
MLVGGIDSGKTTFCTLLANAAVAAGRRVAIVDADVGQSEIGPPTCIGMAVADEPFAGLSDLIPAALAFVGSTSPRGALLEMTVSIRRMADAAAEREPDLTLVDTTGLVRPPQGVRLKQGKFALLNPEQVVALQKRGECEPILASLAHSERVAVHRLPVPVVIANKTAVVRAQRRASRFARYFTGAQVHRYLLDEVALTGTWLNGERPLAPHLMNFIGTSLGVRVFHAERQEGRLCIVSSGPIVSARGIGAVQEEFRTQELIVTHASSLRHLVVGMADGNDKLLGVGLIEELDFRRREIGILSPLRAPAAIRLLHFGLLRVKPDGNELGVNRPGAV